MKEEERAINLDPGTKIKRLIKSLRADEWQDREEAERLLCEIGEPAEPFLKEVIQNCDLETKYRAERLLRRIETKRLGKIVFTKDEDIWIMDFDGENQTRLTDRIRAWGPRLSPDNKKIVFSKTGHGDSEIYVMDVDSKRLMRLTDTKGHDNHPCWSPDGKKIAFKSGRDGQRGWMGITGEIYVMDADGKNQRRITNNNVSDMYPHWSPDGKRIVFVSGRSGKNDNIFIMDTAGKNLTRLTGDKSANVQPCWSPDGQKIAFISDRDGNWEIYVMDADGQNQTRLTYDAKVDRKELYKTEDSGPQWSPDGQKIYFTSRGDTGGAEIYIMDADGKNQTRLTKGGGSTYSVPSGMR